MLPRTLRLPLALAAGSVAFLAWTVAAEAATFTVNSTSDAAYNASTDSCAGGSATCTLRAAVQQADTAGGASTIALAAGTYQLTIAPTGASGSDLNDPAAGDLDINNAASITITGAGASATTVNANSVDRAFTVHAGAGLSLSNMTLKGGAPATQSTTPADGGAIYSAGALSTDDVNFIGDDTPGYGGGLFAAAGSTLSVTGGVFRGNEAAEGGAIDDSSSSAASIQGAAFSANGYYYGAGVYFDGTGTLSVTNSSFANESAYYDGAGIYAESAGTLDVSGSSFTADAAGEYGGAIYTDGNVLNATQDTFTNDSAAYDGYGGAVYVDGAGSVLDSDQFTSDSASYYGGAVAVYAAATVENSTFVGGSAYYGGAVYLDAAATLFNDTMTGNTAGEGGGIYLGGSLHLGLTNDTIVDNTAEAGLGGGVGGTNDATLGSGQGVVNTIIADNTGGDCNAVFASSEVTGYSLDSDSSCFGSLSARSDQTGVQPLLAPVANNGGDVETVRELAGSPSVAAADSADCPATDARGVSVTAGACDIGAYQIGLAGLTTSNSTPASITAGGQFAITLTGTNNGPAPATDLTVSDQLPSGLSLISATPSTGTCTTSGTPADVVCDLGTTSAGTSGSVVLVVSAASAATLSNTGTVTDNEGSTASSTATTIVTAVAASTTTGAPTTTPTTTTPLPAKVGSEPVTQRTHTEATLRAMLTISEGAPTAYFFQYGQSRNYGRTTAGVMTTASGQVSFRVKHLTQHTRYYYRLVTVTDGQVTHGAQRSFVTMGRTAHTTSRHT